jgi:uncharacterized protein
LLTLIERKLSGAEKQTLESADIVFHQTEYERLRNVLQAEYENSSLPEEPSEKPALNDLLIRLITAK